MFIVVSYDIASDKRRGKIARTMENYGKRVQYSVFECNLEEDLMRKMEKELTRVYNPEEDTIRIYILCKTCLSKIKVLGRGEITRDEEVYIV